MSLDFRPIQRLIDAARSLDFRALGVLVRFVHEAQKSGRAYEFMVEALEDKLEKERQR